MRYNIMTFNNYVGIVTDAMLLKNLINNSHVIYLENFDPTYKSDVGIWIQNFYPHLLENFNINIFYINEEWFDYPIDDLKKFNYVICKSKYAYNLIKNYCTAVFLPFISRNFCNPTIPRTNKFLHFMGRSIQKNTELVLNQSLPITLVDPYNRYRPNINFQHVNTYQQTDEITKLLNSHSIHICCSIYESWGHYMFEGLSTGAELICSEIPVFTEQLDPNLVCFIPTVEKIDTSYMYCNDNKNNIYPLRKSFFVDEQLFKDTIENFKPIGKNAERIKLYNHIIEYNKKRMLYFFINL